MLAAGGDARYPPAPLQAAWRGRQGRRSAGGWGGMAWVETAHLPLPSPFTVGDLADDQLQRHAPSAGTEGVYLQQDSHD